jgi:uncharacterized protein YukE
MSGPLVLFCSRISDLARLDRPCRHAFMLAFADDHEKVHVEVYMAQAIMDPEQVRRFAEELKRFNTDLQDRIVSLQARFASLGDTWQDQEHVKFSEEFKQTMKAMKRFIEVSNQHTPYLLRKAQRIEEYLNQR